MTVGGGTRMSGRVCGDEDYHCEVGEEVAACPPPVRWRDWGVYRGWEVIRG